MPEDNYGPRFDAAKRVVDTHLTQRLEGALAKIKGTDSASEKRRIDVSENYELRALIDAAIGSINQIQIASHLLKPTYPDAKVRKTSNLRVNPRTLPATLAVGSHVLVDEFAFDATGNGAYVKKIYEVGRLLMAEFEDRTLLEWLRLDDLDICLALGCAGVDGAAKRKALISVFDDRCEQPASHSNAKQLYWLAGTNAHDEKDFHLLAPLYPTSLVHRVYLQIQDDRFSDEAKAARAARKEGAHHGRPVREYPRLAIQKLGGTKPQNISQLNSERRGDNYLLASLPPVWHSTEVRALLNVDCMFKVFRSRREVKQQALTLRRFLMSKPAANIATRQQVDGLVAVLIDELVFFQAELLTLQVGWSEDPACELSMAQRVWLDPDAERSGGLRMDREDAVDEIAGDFARWVNLQLRDPLPVGDPEFIYWRKLARAEFALLEREVA
jgi:CRISPR-associated protein Csy1